VLTGLRDGEKLHEELLIGNDQTIDAAPQDHEGPRGASERDRGRRLHAAIRSAVAEADDAAIRKIVARWVESGKRVGNLQSAPAS
jgi:FlaA1/EpsC-like NDP-sugar epimerase